MNGSQRDRMRKPALTGKTSEIRRFSGRNYQAETVTIGVAITTVQTARRLSVCDLVHGGWECPAIALAVRTPPATIDAHPARWLNNKFQTFGAFISTFFAALTANARPPSTARRTG